MLAIPDKLYKEQNYQYVCLLLNGTDSRKGYGYGYGYGEAVERKVWYKNYIKKPNMICFKIG
jgi:hypothetical protein